MKGRRMTEETIRKLPIQLSKHICTLKKASMDTTNKISMCGSLMKVVDFDKIPNEYARGKGWVGVPKSNDAIYIDIHNGWFFIEFKNGEVRKEEIYRKIYDSLIILIEWGIIPDLDFARKNMQYILVYNEKKYGKVQPSEAREQHSDYVMRLAKQENCLFGIDDFEKYLFLETHTYTEQLFEEKFVEPKEIEEGLRS